MERLNKLLAHAGVGSRRQCDALVRAGRVSIDGRPVYDLGTKVDPDTQHVSVDGHPVKTERPVYWLVNKPRGVVCTNFDPAGRVRAVDLVPHVEQRVYTVGRLDETSEGLLLLTNDGDLAFQLMHPRFGVEKTYLAQVQGQPSKGDLAQLLQGVWLAEGKVRARRARPPRAAPAAPTAVTSTVFQRPAAFVENVPLARDTYRVRLACPDLAAAIRPGQFLMLRLAGVNDPLLGRPFALYDTFLDAAG